MKSNQLRGEALCVGMQQTVTLWGELWVCALSERKVMLDCWGVCLTRNRHVMDSAGILHGDVLEYVTTVRRWLIESIILSFLIDSLFFSLSFIFYFFD